MDDKNILPFNNFLNEQENQSTPDKKIVPKVAMHFSSNFRKMLQSILKAPDEKARVIAKALLDIEKSDDFFTFSYIDISQTSDDKVSYLQSPRAWRIMGYTSNEDTVERPPEGSDIWKQPNTMRAEQPIGRIIAPIFGDKFSQVSIKIFSDTYKAEYEALTIYDRFKLVEGENIRYWYNEKNYTRDGNGGLLGSCMRYDKAQQYLSIYCYNPDKCNLLILTDPSNKLIGRAIVWKNLRKPKGATFMDRVYVAKQHHFELFKKYATEHGWLYKYNQSAGDASYIDTDGKHVTDGLSVVLKPHKYEYYPYMDTMKYYTPDTGRLGSDQSQPIKKCNNPGCRNKGQEAWVRPIPDDRRAAGEKEKCGICGEEKNFAYVERYKMESTDGGATKM